MKNATKPSAHTPLRDFGDLKRALKSAAKEAAERAEQERAEQAKRDAVKRKAEADRAVFQNAVGPVQSLPDKGRKHHVAPKPAPIPTSREQDEKQVLTESLSDEFDVESLLETDESLAWRRPGLGIDVVRKLRRGVWALQQQLDLHGMRTDEARETLGQFLREAQTKGWRCVRVVHGKGLGSPGRQPVLKDKVKRWLVQSDRVLAFVQARGDDGGAGALVVLLAPVKGQGLPPG
ncbi:MAG: Smr/MutS family protein [Acidobacteriota bacterium]